MYADILTSMYACMHADMHADLPKCICVWMHKCMDTVMYKCRCLYACINAYMYRCTYAYTRYARIYANIPTKKHKSIHAFMPKHIHANINESHLSVSVATVIKQRICRDRQKCASIPNLPTCNLYSRGNGERAKDRTVSFSSTLSRRPVETGIGARICATCSNTFGGGPANGLLVYNGTEQARRNSMYVQGRRPIDGAPSTRCSLSVWATMCIRPPGKVYSMPR